VIESKLNIEEIRKQFPILNVSVNGKPLVYLDNGATTQKPKLVIDAIADYYSNSNANIHRGVHSLSQLATTRYDYARKFIADYINAELAEEVIFTKGTTDSINLIASCFEKFISENDEIIISEMEHHSNILPWQILCEKKKAKLKIIPINDNGELDFAAFQHLLNDKTKLIAITHVSNTLGTINPVKEIISLAHSKNIPVLIDGAQSIPHLKVDVRDLDADFYVFSGHKVYAPTGIGICYAKKKWWNQFSPYQSGGGTIKTVSFEKTEYAEAPHKFEAGTPNIEGVIVLAEALKFVSTIGIDEIHQHENELLKYAESKLKNFPEVKIIGEAKNKAGVISFIVEGAHPFDVGTILDKQGVAVRTGHHCTQPLMNRFGIPGTIRISFAIYNTKEEVDIFIFALQKAIKMLK
jgi:cysteine desulfurase/selenocysteine lyase